MQSATITPELTPSSYIRAQVQRTANSGSLARLAQDSHEALRSSGKRLAGALSMQVLRSGGRRRPTLLQWCMHGWPQESVAQAAQALQKALAEPRNGWHMVSCQVVKGGAAMDESPPQPQAREELCLRFDTPLRFSIRAAEGQAPQLSPTTLLRLLDQRVEALTGRSAGLAAGAATLELLSHFGHLQWAGPLGAQGMRTAEFQGTLFLRDASAALLRALVRLQPWHLVENRDADGVAWRGAYRVGIQREPWLDHALLKRERMALSAQHMVRDTDAAPVLAPGGRVLEPVDMADRLLGELRSGLYRPQPTEAFDLHKPGHAPRRVERLVTLDLLAQRHALHVLTPVFERLFDPHSYGFRPDRSRQDAIDTVRAALRDGFNHVVESDIAQCFPSIDHARLLALVDRALPRSDQVLRGLIRQVMTQPAICDGVLHPRNHGLPQGAPLSPLLTNLMLTRLDQSLDSTRFRYVRYADDFVVLTRSRSDAQEALALVQRVLGDDGLNLAEHKTHVGHVKAGFGFLGESFGPHTLEPLPAADMAQRKPLVVSEPYLQLGVNGEALEVRRQGALVGLWPLRRLSEVLVLGPAVLSSVLVERCQRMDVPVAIAQTSHAGAVSLVAAGRRRFHEQQFQHALWHSQLSDSARLALAKEVVDAKLHNQAMLVSQRRGHDELAETLRETRRQLGTATDTARLRGHEGQAARRCFAWLREQIISTQRRAFEATRRSRGGPDRLNSLLNFLYFLLYARINATARLMALNPYLGWLHDSEDDYESLAYDLMEPFRPFVDRVALRLINRLELRADDFDKATGDYRMTYDAARRTVERFEHGMGERVQGVPLRELLWAQVRSVRLLAGQQGPLWLFRWNPRELLGTAQQPRVLTLSDTGGH